MDWKRLLKFEQSEVLGLDIGSSAVKLVQMRRDNAGWAVTAAGIVDIANGTKTDKIRKEINKEINTVRAISDCLQSSAVQTRLAVCSVCGPEVAVRDFNFPLLPAGETEGAVLLEAKQVCGFNVDEGVVDCQLITDGNDRTSGVLVAATNELVRSKKQLAKEASLNSVLMDVDGLALLNCFSALQNTADDEYEKRETGRATAILNVGSSFTNLAIMGDNRLPFIRDIAYAGEDIVDRIAAENDVSPETVGKILCGGEDSNQPQLELGDSLARACEKLITEVTETLRYYTAQEKAAFVEKILVCGGFALVKGFVELLDNRLAAAAVLWNPFDRIPCEPGQLCEDILAKKGPAMAVAAGLAMRSI